MFNNIFKLPEPLAYDCSVWGYMVGHSQLFVEAYPSNEYNKRFYLWFDDVLYFAGPMKWHGLGFRIGTSDEHESVYNRLYEEEAQIPRVYLAKTHHLYVSSGTPYVVQILAGNVFISRTRNSPLRCESIELQWEEAYAISPT